MTQINVGFVSLAKTGKMKKHFLSEASDDLTYDDEELEIRFIYANGSLSKAFELGAVEFLKSLYGTVAGLLFINEEKKLNLHMLDYSELVELSVLGNDLKAILDGELLKSSNYIETCSLAANYLIGEVKKAENDGRFTVSSNGIYRMPLGAWLQWREYPTF